MRREVERKIIAGEIENIVHDHGAPYQDQRYEVIKQITLEPSEIEASQGPS